jgi:hypothetical protein
LPNSTGNFDAQSGKASQVTSFVAQADTFSTPSLGRSSSEIAAFRAGPIDAV